MTISKSFFIRITKSETHSNSQMSKKTTLHGRFVILEHVTANGEVHWDLMLEDEGRLLTWRLETGPEAIGDEPIEARRSFDHPPRFLTYEGPVQQGTGRVRNAEAGTYEGEGTQEHITLHLHGRTLQGAFRLEKRGEGWSFCKV